MKLSCEAGRLQGILFFLSFFFCCKKLYCFHLFHSLGEGSRAFKKLPGGSREKLRWKP